MNIRLVPNMLDRRGRKTLRRVYRKGKTLKEYLKGIDLNGQRIIVSGKVETDLNRVLKPYDEVILTPNVDDVIGLLILAAKAIWAAALAHPFIAWGTILAVSYSVYSYVTRPRMPSFNMGGTGLDKGSATYSWEGGHTIQDIGVPVPVGYGEHKIWGNIINQYQTTDGDKNYVHLLVLLGEGEWESLSDIKINDNPIANYEGVSYETRLGTNDQSVITGFDDLHDVHSMSVNLLQNSAFTYTTVRDNVEAFELYLSFPSGLFQQDSLGSQTAWLVSYRVRYRLIGGDWTDLGVQTISASHRTDFKRIFRKEGLTAGQYEIEVTRTSSNSSLAQIGDMYLSGVDEIRTEAIAYVNRALLAIKALATNQLQGQVSSLNISCIAKMKKVSVPKVMYGETTLDWEDYYWDPEVEEYKRFEDDASCTWDGSTYIEQYCANPIWCRKDLYLNVRYGLGNFIVADDIDEDLYLEMSRHCEERVSDGAGGYEKRFRLDIYLDSRTNVMDLMSQLDSVFRAITFNTSSSGKLVTRIDKAQTISAQLFGMGNILNDSFSQQWVGPEERYNVIEVQYNDKDKNYEIETLLIVDDESFANGDEPNIKKFRFFGTKQSYAVRAGQYMLRVSKYIERYVTLKSHMNAIACQPGDKVDVAHDVPQIGFSGRVLTGSTADLVKLDRSVTIEADKTYKLRVAFCATDGIEEREVSDAPGTYTELNLVSSFTRAPEAGDNYSFGEENIVVEPMRVVDVERSSSEEVKLSCVPYIDDIYTEGTVVIGETRYSSLSVTFPNVENLSLTEMVVRAKDGTIENTITAWFNRPFQSTTALRVYDHARIYISDDVGVSWEYVGETNGKKHTITGNLETGNTYRIAVVSVTKSGEEGSINSAPYADITLLGKAAKPSDVTNFDVSQQGSKLRFTFDPIPDGDLARYIIKKGSDWATGDIIAERIDATDFEYPVGSIGSQTFMIKAIDSSENESVSAVSDTLIVTPPPEMNFSQEVDPWAQNREYKLTNVARIQMNLFSESYARDVFALQTTETWEDLEDLGQGWEQLGEGGDLDFDKTYETSGSVEQVVPTDLESLFEFTVVLDMLYRNVSGGSITVQISTSEDNTSWSSFANVDPAKNYRARYVKFKYLLATTDATRNIWFYGGTIFLNASTVKVDYGRDLSVPVGGVDILFRDDFTVSPRITSIIILSGTGIGYEVVSLSRTGMTLKLKDITGSYTSGVINWEVKGG